MSGFPDRTTCVVEFCCRVLKVFIKGLVTHPGNVWLPYLSNMVILWKRFTEPLSFFFNCTQLHLCQRWLLRSVPCVWQSCFQIYISSHPASAMEWHLFSIKIIFICLRGLGKCFLPTAAALAPPFRSRLIANLGLFHRVNHWLFSSVFLRLPSTTL